MAGGRENSSKGMTVNRYNIKVRNSMKELLFSSLHLESLRLLAFLLPDVAIS